MATYKETVTTLPSTGERLLTEWRNQDTAEHLHRYFLASTYATDKDVLDIASGEGYGSHLLASYAKSVTGVDISEEAVKHARIKYTQNNLKYEQGDAASIPLGDAVVDLVVSFETLEHHDKHREMLSEIKRVLRPGGVLIMSTPDKRTYSDLPRYSNPYHVKELYVEEFESLLKEFFQSVNLLFQCTRFGSLITPQDSASGFQSFSGNFEGFLSKPTVTDPHYVICVASDSPIPATSASFLDETQMLVDAATEESRHKAHMLQQALASRSKELDDVKNSVSFKFGRAITSPLRWFSGD